MRRSRAESPRHPRGLGRLGLLLLTTLWGLSPASAAELGFYGWGPRVGVADSPDQLVLGLHQDFGEFIERLRFQVSLELGFGDDRSIIALTLPVHYRFRVDEGFVPYLGGGLVVGFIDVDRDRPGGGSEIEIAPVLVGGFEKPLRGDSDLLLELHLTPSDSLHDAKVVVGWMFRAK